jgi:hypothetical protein
MSFGLAALCALGLYTLTASLFLIWANWRIEKRKQKEEGQQ